MVNGKVYIVTSPELVGAVNRHSKALAFNPFIAEVGKRITGHDEATGHIVQHNLNGEDGTGYVLDVHDGIVAALSPGNDLEDMTAEMLHEADVYLQELRADKEIDLFKWIRRTITSSSARGIYGPESPFNKDPSLNDAFWDFDRGLNRLMVGILPRIISPKGYRGRTKIAAGFRDYFEKYVPGRTKSSAFTLARYTANNRYGITVENQGLLEVGTLVGILANTIPTAFYMLVRVYSDATLLHDIREELESNAVSSGPNEMTKQINIMAVREKCPLLYATFQELLRIHSLGTGSRYVREDVVLNNQYLLKKDTIIQMPTEVMHTDPAIWGDDAQDFRPSRFLKGSKKQTGTQADGQVEMNRVLKNTSSAYRPFGGGAALCPGKHFVALELLGLTACMVLRFDMVPVAEKWIIPPQKQESLATNVFTPVHDVRVKISSRRGFEDVVWNFVTR